MAKSRKELRILLMQIRQDERVKQEEHASFCDYAGLQADQLHTLNLFEQSDFGSEVLDGFDALFVGGASKASVLEPQTFGFIAAARRLMRHCIATDIPVFASCFGFQLAVLEMGGVITRDSSDFEMGTLPIEITEAGAGDLVFADTHSPMLAVAVHQESALSCPPDCIELARTNFCCHAFRVEGKPFWAFQFHPELDKARLLERLTIYKAGYTEDEAHLDQVLAGLQETPDSNALLGRFVSRVLLA